MPNERFVFARELIIDLYECDEKAISSEPIIRTFAKELSRLLDMNPHSDPVTPYLAIEERNKGYGLAQFSETGSITGRFSENHRTVYLNIFSCGPLDADKVEQFAGSCFGAKRFNSRLLIRE